MKRIAALTMVRNDSFFLRKWVEYYGRELGKENLYIYFDGLDQEVPDFCEGTNTRCVEKIGSTVMSGDKGRIRFLSGEARKLFGKGYGIVIGGDGDEYLVVDPKAGKSLAEYLNEIEGQGCLSGLGLDFGQKMDEEPALTPSVPFLERRHYAQIGTRYTKASVLFEPLEWGSGFHRVKGRNFHIGKDLFLLHFGYSDMKMIEARFGDKDRADQGWGKHVKKRSRTIRFVSTLPARDFDKWTSLARRIETLVRPPYAWNKPGLLGMRIVVRIPERFADIL